MKNSIQQIALFILLLNLVSCNNSEIKVEEVVKVDRDYFTELFEEEFEPLNLTSFEIKAEIQIPNEFAPIQSSIIPKVIHEPGDYKWTISSGSEFIIKIEDWGNENILNEIGLSLSKGKTFFDITILDSTTNYISYRKKLIPNGLKNTSDNIGLDHSSYHCYRLVSIDSVNYIFSSDLDGVSKKVFDYLSLSIKSVRPLQNEI
ncbi:MAG: hypothetical protein ACPGU5_06635 [Lishizhenia sp.]